MLIRIRLGEKHTLDVRTVVWSESSVAVPPGTRTLAAEQPKVVLPEGISATRPVVALVEAVPSRGEELAATLASVALDSGCRCGVLSLEPHNRFASRFGCTRRFPAEFWRTAAPEMMVKQGGRCVIAAPASEEELDPRHVSAVIQQLRDETDLVVIDLGCRWTPLLFRAVFMCATAIWVVVRSGQWAGAEMRLEQAELSGWTDMQKVRLVVVGEELVAPSHLHVAGVLPDPLGQSARQFVAAEVGRGLR